MVSRVNIISYKKTIYYSLYNTLLTYVKCNIVVWYVILLTVFGNIIHLCIYYYNLILILILLSSTINNYIGIVPPTVKHLHKKHTLVTFIFNQIE